MEREKYSLTNWLEDDATPAALDENYGSFGFYDWFCKDASLENKAKSLAGKLRKILKLNETSKHFDPATCYVFFKNNCPMSGPLYDDFRICDIETGDVLFTITPKSGHTGRAELAGRVDANGIASPTAEFADLVDGTWDDVLQWFGKPAKKVKPAPKPDLFRADPDYHCLTVFEIETNEKRTFTADPAEAKAAAKETKRGIKITKHVCYRPNNARDLANVFNGTGYAKYTEVICEK